MIPFLPGVAAICGAKNIPAGAQKLFALGSLIQTILAAIFYYAFCLISPPAGGIATKWNEIEPGDDFVPRVYPEIDGMSMNDLEKADINKEFEVTTGVDEKKSE